MAPSVFCYAKSTSLPEGGVQGAGCVLGTVWKDGRSKLGTPKARWLTSGNPSRPSPTVEIEVSSVGRCLGAAVFCGQSGTPVPTVAISPPSILHFALCIFIILLYTPARRLSIYSVKIFIYFLLLYI